MGTNFPGSNDVFTVPSTPATTALGSAGDTSPARNNTLNHGDLGAALMAMQAEATYLAHTHDGTTRNGSQLVQANTHQSPDTDTATTALHHTIGTGANQGAAGNHTHSAATIWPVGAIYISLVAGNPSTFGLPGTWTAVTGVFVVAAGSTFTAGTTGGAATHVHTPTYTTTGGHFHVTPNSDSNGGHGHSNNGTGTSSFDHNHGTTGSNYSVWSSNFVGGSGSSSLDPTSHAHSSNSASSSGSSTSHSHSVSSVGTAGAHTHTIADTDTQGDHAHTASIASSSHIPAYLAVNVWERTA